MSMKFVPLKLVDPEFIPTGETAWINLNRVRRMQRIEGETIIIFTSDNGGMDFVTVHETPEQIIQMPGAS